MKYIIFLCLLPLFAFAQRPGEVIRDTLFFSKGVTECGDSVWLLNEYVELRGGRKFTNSQPVGFNENDPCSGVRARDTATLVSSFANPLIDFGRQIAQQSKPFIFLNRSLDSYNAVNRALTRARLPGIFSTVERQFADSLVGNYILVRPSVANVNVSVTKTQQGAVRVRLNAQTNFPITVYADTWIRVRNVAGANTETDLYQIEPGRWTSIDRAYQLLKSARQQVRTTGK